MRKKFFALILVLINAWPLPARLEPADTIQKVLSDAIPDTSRAFNIAMLTMYPEPENMEKVHAPYKKVFDFSLARRQDHYAGLAFYYEATPCFRSGKYTKQRGNLKRAIDLKNYSEHYKANSQPGAVYGGLSCYYQVVEKMNRQLLLNIGYQYAKIFLFYDKSHKI